MCGWSRGVCPRRFFASHHQFSPPSTHPPSFPSAIETTAFVCVLLWTPSTHTDSSPLPPTHTRRHRSHLFVLRDSSSSNHGNVRVGVVEERREGGGRGGRGDDDACGQCWWTSYTPAAGLVVGTFNVTRVALPGRAGGGGGKRESGGLVEGEHALGEDGRRRRMWLLAWGLDLDALAQ